MGLQSEKCFIDKKKTINYFLKLHVWFNKSNFDTTFIITFISDGSIP